MHRVARAHFEALNVVEKVHMGHKDRRQVVQSFDVLNMVNVEPSKNELIRAQAVPVLEFILYSRVGRRAFKKLCREPLHVLKEVFAQDSNRRHHPNLCFDCFVRNAKSRAHGTCDRVKAVSVGIYAMILVHQRRATVLCQDPLTTMDLLIQQQARVMNHLILLHDFPHQLEVVKVSLPLFCSELHPEQLLACQVDSVVRVDKTVPIIV